MRGLTPEQVISLSGQGIQGTNMAMNLLLGQQQESRARESQPSEIALREAQTADLQETATANRLQREFEASPAGQEIKATERQVKQMEAQAKMLKAQADIAGVPSEIARAKAAMAEAEVKVANFNMMQSTVQQLNEANATLKIGGVDIPMSYALVDPAAFKALSDATAGPQNKFEFSKWMVENKFAQNEWQAMQMMEATPPIEVAMKALVARMNSPRRLENPEILKMVESLNTLITGMGGTHEEQAASQQMLQELLGQWETQGNVGTPADFYLKRR